MTEFIVTKLERDAEGHWAARVTPSGGRTMPVTRRYGSWMVDSKPLREVPSKVAAALQQRVRRLESRERAEI